MSFYAFYLVIQQPDIVNIFCAVHLGVLTGFAVYMWKLCSESDEVSPTDNDAMYQIGRLFFYLLTGGIISYWFPTATLAIFMTIPISLVFLLQYLVENEIVYYYLPRLIGLAVSLVSIVTIPWYLFKFTSERFKSQ